MTLDTLKYSIQTGREIEFSYRGAEYSITYSFEGEKQTIHFCQFDQTSIDYDSIEQLIDSAKIGSEYLRDILGSIEDVTIY